MPVLNPEMLVKWGERAQEARRLVKIIRKRMSITELAARLRTREKVVYRWASGQVAPRQATLVKLRALAAPKEARS